MTYEIKIYKIWWIDNDKDLYVGSTKQILSKRMSHHRSDCRCKKNKMKLYETMRENGYKFKYILLDSYKVKAKDEQLKWEQYWIDKLQPNLNKYNAVCKVTKNDYDKVYRKKNKERISDYQKEYRSKNQCKIKENKKNNYIKNKEKFIQKAKERYQLQKEDIKIKRKEYYIKNREPILAKMKENADIDKKREYDKIYNQKNMIKRKARNNERIECKCGISYTRANKNYHFNTRH